MTKTEIKNLEERVNQLNPESSLTTDEGNVAQSFWVNLHWTKEEGNEYARSKERMKAISAAAGSVYNAEQNQEYMKLSGRCTELTHDIAMRRVSANDAMRDQIWPELVPRAIRFSELTDRPEDTLSDVEMRELNDLTAWFMDLRVKAVESAEKQLAAKTSHS